eukprot:7158251-Karenia_brevis.AAC.1
MKCMVKTIFDGIEKTQGEEAAAQEIAIKNWKEPWIIASNKGAIQAVCTFQMTDRAVQIEVEQKHFEWVRQHFKDNFKSMYKHLVPSIVEGDDTTHPLNATIWKDVLFASTKWDSNCPLELLAKYRRSA